MKWFQLLLISVAMSLVACEGTIELGETTVMPQLPSAGGPKADNLSTASAAPNGGALYQQYCASCHGADATGGPSYPSSILGFTPVDSVILNGLPAMPAIPLQQDEVDAIQSFLVGGSTTEPTDPAPIDGSTPALQVYAAECATCHGAEGLGTNVGPPIRLRDGGLTRFTVRQGRNGPGNPTTMPVYDRSAISDGQLDEIVDWLDAFPNPTTGEGLFNQYCANCHGADGTGGTSFEAVAGTLRATTVIREGHGGDRYANRSEYMTAWTPDQISDAEIVMIEQYMREL